MNPLSRFLRKWIDHSTGDEGLHFRCPGCNEPHMIKTKGDGSWGWNGDVEKPTFTPSVMVTGTMMTDKGRADYEAWRVAGMPERNGVPFDSAPYCCHLFVTDGQVQFLSDCTHALAGQTVPLAPIPQRVD